MITFKKFFIGCMITISSCAYSMQSPIIPFQEDVEKIERIYTKYKQSLDSITEAADTTLQYQNVATTQFSLHNLDSRLRAIAVCEKCLIEKIDTTNQTLQAYTEKIKAHAQEDHDEIIPAQITDIQTKIAVFSSQTKSLKEHRIALQEALEAHVQNLSEKSMETASFHLMAEYDQNIRVAQQEMLQKKRATGLLQKLARILYCL